MEPVHGVDFALAAERPAEFARRLVERQGRTGDGGRTLLEWVQRGGGDDGGDDGASVAAIDVAVDVLGPACAPAVADLFWMGRGELVARALLRNRAPGPPSLASRPRPGMLEGLFRALCDPRSAPDAVEVAEAIAIAEEVARAPGARRDRAEDAAAFLANPPPPAAEMIRGGACRPPSTPPPAR